MSNSPQSRKSEQALLKRAERGNGRRRIGPARAPARKAPFGRSLHVALLGLLYVLRRERNAQIQAVIGLLVIGAGIVLRISVLEWAIVWLLICTVLAVEALNTAVEAAVDLVTEEYHELAKVAKDSAAGAVLLTTIGSVGVGIAIFGPRLWRIFF